MRLVTFIARNGAGEELGAWIRNDEQIVRLKQASPDFAGFNSMQALIESGDEGLDRAREIADRAPETALVPTSEVRLRPPLHPRRISGAPIFSGKGHLQTAFEQTAIRMAAIEGDIEKHRATLNAMLAKFATFRLFPSQGRDHMYISGPDEEIVAPYYAIDLDYESEIGCVIGKTGRDIKLEDATSHIFGYTIFNDWSARDRQTRNLMAGLGMGGDAKDFDGGNCFGPCIVTRDEIDPYNVEMIARVNGEEWTRALSKEHSLTFEDYIVGLSDGRSIFAGEIWSSGTPHLGCGLELGRTVPDGATVEIEIPGIGILRNTVRIPGAA